MRLSEFRGLVCEVFGDTYASTLCREMALTGLDSLTADEALAKGVAPRDVWHALCDQMDVPESQRRGLDPRQIVPPRR